MKITFYLGDNQGVPLDARNIEQGNPGVGGAHFCILQLAHYLSLSPKYSVSVLSVREYLLKPNIGFMKINGDDEVIDLATSIKTDILVLKQFPKSSLESSVKSSNLKVIVWSHNFLSYDFCRFIKNTPQIKVNVFVGKQQYDAYLDDDVIRKSVYIPNMVGGPSCNKRNNDSKTVVFMGAICRKKGFLEMCKIWPGIVKDVPDAKLVVLGSGSLYGNRRLGSYGIAEESYEKQFIPFITNERGEILPSVEFKGVVGHEKNDIFKNASVGVVNPSGSRETFGMVIVEMGKYGLPVATIGTTGYFDTIIDKHTGFLSVDLKELQRDIINLLKNREINIEVGGVA